MSDLPLFDNSREMVLMAEQHTAEAALKDTFERLSLQLEVGTGYWGLWRGVAWRVCSGSACAGAGGGWHWLGVVGRVSHSGAGHGYPGHRCIGEEDKWDNNGTHMFRLRVVGGGAPISGLLFIDLASVLSCMMQEERRRSDALLYQMIPPHVADTLRRGERAEAETYPEATILFSDVVGELSVLEMLAWLSSAERSACRKREKCPGTESVMK